MSHPFTQIHPTSLKHQLTYRQKFWTIFSIIYHAWMEADGGKTASGERAETGLRQTRRRAFYNHTDLRQRKGRIIKCQRRRREAEREGRKHKTTTLGSGGGSSWREGSAEDLKYGGQCGILVHAHTHSRRHTHQMGLEGLKRGYSSSLSSTQTRQF